MIRAESVSSIDSLAMPVRRKVFDKTFLPAGQQQPLWATLPLDQKIPVCPSPRGAFTFYTNKLGEPKYINDQRHDFDLTNPQGREAPQEYDSLQDPSLRTYFTSPRTKRHLVDNGLITNRGEIKCNVKEFNEYRAFVRYRSVTELSLQKKAEKRMEQEEKDALFLEWPNVHKKNHKPRKADRKVYSEPPRRSEPPSGLDMYKEDLSAGLRRTEKARRQDELRRSGRGSQLDLRTPRNQTPSSPRKLSGYGQPSPRHNNDAALFGNSKLSLVEEMRRREAQLKQRMEEQRREREEEHRRRMEENWQDRQKRQEKLLANEAELNARTREERTQHIMEREKTLHAQRSRQEAQLRKLKSRNAVNTGVTSKATTAPTSPGDEGEEET